jgi:AraC-like DNA-binding protein
MPAIRKRSHLERKDWTLGADRLAPFVVGPDPMVHPLLVRYCLEELKQRGLDTKPILHGLDFSIEDLQRPEFRLSYTKASETIWRVISAIEDPDLGLIIGKQHHIMSWGLVGLGAMACPTLEEAIAFGFEHQEPAGCLLSLRVRQVDRQLSIVASARFADVSIERILVDGIFAALAQAGRVIIGSHFKPTAVELVSRQIASVDRYKDTFQCTVLFGCMENKLVVDLGDLTDNIDSANPAVLKMAAAALLRERANSSVAVFSRQVVEPAIQDNLQMPPSPADLAASMGLNERTLRRKLAQEGTTYYSILDLRRRSRALELLLLGRRSAVEVANALGFGDVRSLGRAFKRWTGRTLPTQSGARPRIGR